MHKTYCRRPGAQARDPHSNAKNLPESNLHLSVPFACTCQGIYNRCSGLMLGLRGLGLPFLGLQKQTGP